ncbi:serine hydrolase domain-containing protein [Tundrisphaera sp. TA3]|uniref:serine hydrolase domain-containing protein n=1 Tax=Tundrisphaera sp. TA3 TaxID=3435775 RepID=UPI003EC0A24D
MGDDLVPIPAVAPPDRPAMTRRDLLRAGALALIPGSMPLRAADPTPGDLAPFDNLMTGFLRVAEVPGASLAVARDGRMVYARGFGRADQDRDEPVGADSLFRIASLAKPITSAAVFRLIDAGKLRLDDRIFDVLDLGREIPEGKTLDARWREITIYQLLRHMGGWDRSRSIDPMLRMARRAWESGPDPSHRAWAIIREMLGRPLDDTPGTHYAYSNFGYALLGRAIERVTGQAYADHVREAVLAPAGATGMRLGKTLLADRAPGEVRYHDGDKTGPASYGPEPRPDVPRPYGVWCLEAMDSHGGWIASAADLVRFAVALDRPSQPLVSAEAFRAMTARPGGSAGHTKDGDPTPVYYGCGWLVRPNARTGRCTMWHSGALNGTSSLLVRRSDGITFAALFNARYDAGENELSRIIDPLVNKAIARIRSWPDGEPLIRVGTS